ncbi:MAG: hypothetical protein QNK92_10820 [Amylibacter sp.]
MKTALNRRGPGPYQVQAAIQAVHAEAESFAATGWTEILGLYGALLQYYGSAFVRLNWCVALSFVKGADAALTASGEFAADLDNYQPYHAERAAFYRAAGWFEDADAAYGRAIELS